MGYYQGDFYAGARGDPGIGSFFKGLASTVAGFIPGVGGGLSKIISGIGGGAPKLLTGGGAATAGRGVSGIVKATKGIIMRHPTLTAAGAAGAVGALAGGVAGRLTRSGRPFKKRRMNVCNPRALRRSIRRTHGFAKLAMRTIHLVHPKKKVRFGGFRKKKTK